MTPSCARPILLAVILAGCIAHKPLVLPEIPDRAPLPIVIYVVVDDRMTWDEAVWFAVKLGKVGFRPAIVSDVSQIPPDAPVVEAVGEALDADESCDEDVSTLLWTLTVGVFPNFRCRVFGTTFDLRRELGSPPLKVDTRWRVQEIVGWLAIPIGSVAGYEAFSYPLDDIEARDMRALRAAVEDALDAKPAP